MFIDFINSEAGQAIIHKRFAEAVDQAMKEALGYRGDFHHQLTELIKRVLALPEHFDMATYNASLVAIVKRRIETYCQNCIENVVGKEIEDLLEPPPVSIKLSELIEKYIEDLRENVAEDDFDDHEATVIFDVSDRGFKTLYLDEDAGKTMRNASIVIRFHDDQFWRLEFNDLKNESELFANPRYDFEKVLFQMKSGGTKVEFDMDQHDVENKVDRGYTRYSD